MLFTLIPSRSGTNYQQSDRGSFKPIDRPGLMAAGLDGNVSEGVTLTIISLDKLKLQRLISTAWMVTQQSDKSICGDG